MHSKSAKKDGMHVSHLATTAPALLCCRCHGLKVGFNMATSTYQAAPPHKTAPALLCCRCHGGSLPRPSRSPTDSTSTTMLPVLQTKFMNNYISFNVYIITPVPFMMSVNPPWKRHFCPPHGSVTGCPILRVENKHLINPEKPWQTLARFCLLGCGTMAPSGPVASEDTRRATLVLVYCHFNGHWGKKRRKQARSCFYFVTPQTPLDTVPPLPAAPVILPELALSRAVGALSHRQRPLVPDCGRHACTVEWLQVPAFKPTILTMLSYI